MHFMARKIFNILFAVLLSSFSGMMLAVAADLFPHGRTPAAEPALHRTDTITYNNNIFTKYRKEKIKTDSISAGFASKTEKSSSDTIKAPDSLKTADPFKYKYYIAIKDSLSHILTRDSLLLAKDSVSAFLLDSLYKADSVLTAKLKFEKWYASLDKYGKKKYNLEQKLKRDLHRTDSIQKVKERKKEIRDSIIKAEPRILETFALTDSMQYKRIVAFTSHPYNNRAMIREVDSSYNYFFNDYPFLKEDVNAVYQGIAGSATMQYDFFKRRSNEKVSFYTPYEIYSFSPSTLKQYNTKTPYTELAYWGTLFSGKQTEEADIHILTTQNITPGLNFRLSYDRFGANGILLRESTDNRTFVASGNYLGKNYSAAFGYIYNKIGRKENGGISDLRNVTDTIMGAKDIKVNLSDAENLIKKHIFFLNQTYGIPFKFLEKVIKKDSSGIKGGDITTAFIGHNSEISFYRKIYKDRITDDKERNFYGNNFYIHPMMTNDSVRVCKIENKLFVSLRPWSKDFIVTGLYAGIGNVTDTYYMHGEMSYFSLPKNIKWSSVYVYGGASGNYRKYMSWGADAKYTLLGKQIFDTEIKGNLKINLFPFRKHKHSPLSWVTNFETSVKEPDFFEQNYYSNHFKWNNEFGKTYMSKIESAIEIPHVGFFGRAGYALLKNYIYYNFDGMVAQEKRPISIASLKIEQNFKLWKFHFDNNVLLQVSSNKDVLPLPSFSANFKWYLQLDIYKMNTRIRAMQMQLGVNTYYNSFWNLPKFNPAISQFYNQNTEQFGNCPYFDIFVNMQWKRASIFVKLINAGMGAPSNRTDYFSAYGYLRPQRTFKFGIFWPFYTTTKKHRTMSSHAGSSESSGGFNLNSIKGKLKGAANMNF